MVTDTKSSGSRGRARAFRDDVLCPCTEMTHVGFRAFLQENPTLSFEDILSKTGAGRNCTACMLDLEYSFGEAGRGKVTAPNSVVPTASPERIGVKRALYKLIDGAAPLVSSCTDSWSPVLYGKNIDQWLWIANQHLMYKNEMEGPVPHCANVTVRDAVGRVCHSQRYDIPVDDVLGVDLSAYLSPNEGTALAVGSVQVVQTWKRPGLRGTTRAQIEIVTPNAVCAVHTQAPGPAATQHFTALHRPHEERLFFTVVNPVSKPLVGSAIANLAESEEEEVAEFVVPGHGVLLREVDLAKWSSSALDNSPVNLTWHIEGPHKLHFLCATPNLDRFSIDHL